MLLTISIPTYNRSKYLEKCLDRILISRNELNKSLRSNFQVFISDNSENILTSKLVRSEKYKTLNIIYKKNEINIGSDANIAQSLCYPNSKYVMLLGDDDFLTKQSLLHILSSIQNFQYSLLCMNFYGLTKNEERKFLNEKIKTKTFNNGADLFEERNIKLAFISGLIFKRDLYEKKDVDLAIGSNLVHFNLVLYLLQKANLQYLFIENFLIEVTRNNTGGYNPIEIFYVKFWNLVYSNSNLNLEESKIKQIKRRVLSTFYVRSFGTFIKRREQGLSKQEILPLDTEFKDYIYYILIYRILFRKYSNRNFAFLNALYLIGNLRYDPKYFLKIMNHLRYVV